MDGSQQFRLKWNNYHVNIATSFDFLRVEEDFVDVTVACDGFQTKAHRMVLSACSPYFRELLKVTLTWERQRFLYLMSTDISSRSQFLCHRHAANVVFFSMIRLDF